MPNKSSEHAPVADLRTLRVGRRGDARLSEVKSPLALSSAQDALFCTKGSASADAFEPAFQGWGDMRESNSSAYSAVVSRPGDALRPLVDPQDRRADDPLVSLEQTFIEFHQRALLEGGDAEADAEEIGAEEEPNMPVRPEGAYAPLADLRSLCLRRSARDVALIDELFVQKGRAAQEPRELNGNPAIGRDLSLAPVPVEQEAASAGVGDPQRPATPSAPPQASADSGPSTSRSLAEAAAATRSSAPRKRRPSAVTPLQSAIILFGCVAVLVGGGAVFPAYGPPPQSERVAQALPAPAPSSAVAHPDVGADFLASGDERLRRGDVVAARLFYVQAANAGSARGALMVGATYDPKFLASIGVYGVAGDEKTAATWYARAGQRGVPAAADLAQALRGP